ncbi:MAG: aspartate/glutamate racemase family protein [Rhizomicrobium sp.]
MRKSAERLKAAGADFWICPDNTAHMAFEALREPLALPGLHIARIVADEAACRGFAKIGITGTLWTMKARSIPPPSPRPASLSPCRRASSARSCSRSSSTNWCAAPSRTRRGRGWPRSLPA